MNTAEQTRRWLLLLSLALVAIGLVLGFAVTSDPPKRDIEAEVRAWIFTSDPADIDAICWLPKYGWEQEGYRFATPGDWRGEVYYTSTMKAYCYSDRRPPR